LLKVIIVGYLDLEDGDVSCNILELVYYLLSLLSETCL